MAGKLKKDYGHKLQKLYCKALELGLPENDRTGRMIGFIDDTYSFIFPAIQIQRPAISQLRRCSSSMKITIS
ncbi:hypothetical protein Rleg9DRAFT_6000 [Rhizobium leguminosarum bv. trifolii WSM597]|uniref:Uncharacterized protein n=1 Tax=Rhizobium leguminosarum bv. trifolii WSM597 TaxID=754764 RepID=J0H9F6_RHILT|nr:hypothetical protein [Rhizobium leguminosarum]EJB07030.1 hypothetical protein Rleg9DRAFT_6000 [Rhizobium leguminosarum bv. trifolii WSM597]